MKDTHATQRACSAPLCRISHAPGIEQRDCRACWEPRCLDTEHAKVTLCCQMYRFSFSLPLTYVGWLGDDMDNRLKVNTKRSLLHPCLLAGLQMSA